MARRAIIACIGAGRMGRGIAQSVAYAGHAVRLIDARQRDAQAFERLREEALGEVRAGLASIASLGGFDPVAIPLIMARIGAVSLDEAANAIADADIVFEAVPETKDAKRGAFALFDAHAGADTVLASTTSTMLSTELAGFTAHPERFLNAHWLNPALLMPLVELSPARETSDGTLALMRGFLEGIGKMPIVCKASPGYIVPRIQALAMNEAARIVEEGVASAEDVDKAVTYGFGLRFGVLGLLEFIDWGGGDILYHASRYLAEAFDDERYAPPPIISRNMEEGRIGLKTGSGFFDYGGIDVDAYRRRRTAAFLKALGNAGLVRAPVLEGDA